MKSNHLIKKTLIAGTLLLSSTAQAEFNFFGLFSGDVAPVTDNIYQEECSSCHMAYQPGLMPASSWKQILSAKNLLNHFGENAEMDEETRLHILKVAVENAADNSTYHRSEKIMSSLRGNVPKRIIDIPYIRRKHHEVYEGGIVGKNRPIKSISQCNVCHQDTKKGVYDEDSVRIPGVGNRERDWD